MNVIIDFIKNILNTPLINLISIIRGKQRPEGIENSSIQFLDP